MSNCMPNGSKLVLDLVKSSDGSSEIARKEVSRPRNRERRTFSDHKFVRLVSGTNLYQARPWHPVVGSINLGLYQNDTAAGQVVRKWIQAGCDPCKGLPPGILPKWVKEIDGRFYGVRSRAAAVNFGPFATAEEAHAAMRERYERRPASRRKRNHSRAKPNPRVTIRQRRNRFLAHAVHPAVGVFRLGEFATRFEAERISENWLRQGADPCKGLPSGKVPKWVTRTIRRLTGERAYGASMRIDGILVRIQDEYPSAEDAFHAALAFRKKWRRERDKRRLQNAAEEVSTSGDSTRGKP